MKKLAQPVFIKLSLLALSILMLIALPQSPYLIVKGIKKKAGQVEFLIPANTLSEGLAVNNCSEERLSTVYDSPTNFNIAKSGLNVFKSRLAKEYKDSSKNFIPLAQKVLSISQATESQSNTCLLPLKISVNPKLAVDKE